MSREIQDEASLLGITAEDLRKFRNDMDTDRCDILEDEIKQLKAEVKEQKEKQSWILYKFQELIDEIMEGKT